MSDPPSTYVHSRFGYRATVLYRGAGVPGQRIVLYRETDADGTSPRVTQSSEETFDRVFVPVQVPGPDAARVLAACARLRAAHPDAEAGTHLKAALAHAYAVDRSFAPQVIPEDHWPSAWAAERPDFRADARTQVIAAAAHLLAELAVTGPVRP